MVKYPDVCLINFEGFGIYQYLVLTLLGRTAPSAGEVERQRYTTRAAAVICVACRRRATRRHFFHFHYLSLKTHKITFGGLEDIFMVFF